MRLSSQNILDGMLRTAAQCVLVGPLGHFVLMP